MLFEKKNFFDLKQFIYWNVLWQSLSSDNQLASGLETSCIFLLTVYILIFSSRIINIS